MTHKSKTFTLTVTESDFRKARELRKYGHTCITRSCPIAVALNRKFRKSNLFAAWAYNDGTLYFSGEGNYAKYEFKALEEIKLINYVHKIDEEGFSVYRPITFKVVQQKV